MKRLKIWSTEIFNTDQGSQFTSDAFIDVLKSNGIQISMDGKGRWVDNVMVERYGGALNMKRCISKLIAVSQMRKSN